MPKLLYHGNIKIFMILVIFWCKIGISHCILFNEMHCDTECLNNVMLWHLILTEKLPVLLLSVMVLILQMLFVVVVRKNKEVCTKLYFEGETSGTHHTEI